MVSGLRTQFARVPVWVLVCVALLYFQLGLPASVRAQQSDEHDNYKLKIDGFWFYSKPTGTIHAQSDEVPVDLTKDLNFGSYSTFAGKIDWKFTHKNHFYVNISPLYTTKSTTLARDITFQGIPFYAGADVTSTLHALLIAPGYQYDIIRRRRGHIGIGVQLDLFDTTAKIKALGTVNGGTRNE